MTNINKQELALQKRLYRGVSDSRMKSMPQSIDRRKHVMVTLWERMADIFGNYWGLNYGEPGGRSMQTWAAGLAKYSESQIKHGVEQLANWNNRFPPNLGQFSALCLSSQPKTLPPSDIKQLSDFTKPKRGDSEIARREKKRMARIQAGEDVETKEESMRNLGFHVRHGA